MTVIDQATPEARAVVRRARRRTSRRTTWVAAGLTAALIGALAVRTMLGDYIITFPDFLRIVGGADIPGASWILMESKLPRAVLGLLVGAAFGAAGAIFQTVLRNPLASPDILGVNFGASASAVVAIVVVGATGWTVSAFAIGGALGVAVLVRLLVGSNGGNRLILVGIGLTAALFALVQYLFTRADEWDAQLVLQWLTGSLNRADWSGIRLLLIALLVLAPLVAITARSARVNELGDDAAAGLGVSPARSDLALLLAILLCALATAASGPLAFVAFLSGPISRALNAGRSTVVGAALAGAVLVVGADHLAAYLVPDVNYPVGVVTGALGAPFLMWLLATGRASRSA